MNDEIPSEPLKWLFLDLNAYFASCEQQENPVLRGKPVVIVQTMAETACAIAASYEAKRLGVKTGTLVHEARRLCPNVIPVKARHDLYADYHRRIVAAVETCLPVEQILSIDEMACRLMGREMQEPVARELALAIKRVLCERVGQCMTCSIGLAPNVFLGKVGSDLQKPDGLVVLNRGNLPGALKDMVLQDIYGIGPGMEQRLNRVGIYDVSQLWQASSEKLRRAWGGIHGVLFHQMLHGADVQPSSSPHSKSMGHQHVLEPELRTKEGARSFSFHLLSKAAERLRRHDYYCKRLGLSLSWCGENGRWWDEIGFHETADSAFLLARLANLWSSVPPFKPLAVSIVLTGLVPASAHQPDLFASNPRKEKLSPLIDRINQKFGRHAVGFGLLPPMVRIFKGHAAFQRVPEEWEF